MKADVVEERMTLEEVIAALVNRDEPVEIPLCPRKSGKTIQLWSGRDE
jgi:hypothetical protein